MDAQARKNAIALQERAKEESLDARNARDLTYVYPSRLHDHKYWLKDAARMQECSSETYLASRYYRDHSD